MRTVKIVLYLASTFSFLTVGSLMIIVALEVLTMEDALLKVQMLYENPWQSLKLGALGLTFVVMGLYYSKALVKETKPRDEVELCGKWGQVHITKQTVAELVHKRLLKIEGVEEARASVRVNNNRLKVSSDIMISHHFDAADMTEKIQNDITGRIERLLGSGAVFDLEVHITGMRDTPLKPVGV